VSPHPEPGVRLPASSLPAIRRLTPFLVFFVTFALYAATAAPATLFGDPSEYQVIPAILGIAHPPGYAFYTLLAKLWQMTVPIGTIAFRTNLLSVAAGAWVVTGVYLIVHDLGTQMEGRANEIYAAFAALSLAAAPDLWQHAIHANSHIVSVALTTTHLWLLIRWWRSGHDRWLAAFATTLGLGAAHHPITLMGVPAYGLFILAVWLPVLRQWRRRFKWLTARVLVLAGCLLLGLTPYLYFPLRSPHLPAGFEPRDMHTWEGFRRHVTAEGLRVNLFHFGLADQPDRALVFWSLLRLQFPLFTILCAVASLVWLVRRAPKSALLLIPFLGVHLAFTLNTVQDVMAYLLIPFSALAVTAGLGALALVQEGARVLHRSPFARQTLFPIVLSVLLAMLPLYQAVRNLQRGISLRDFKAAEEYVAAAYDRFAGREEGAIVLSDWEHLTPLWVHTYTQGEPLDTEDVKRLVYVNPADLWVESVWQHIEQGPVYVVGYRPAVRNAGFRLQPDGPFYRVVAPPATEATPSHLLDVWAERRVHVLGYDLPKRAIQAGEPLTLALYQSVAQPLEEIWMPYAQLGPVEARWTTDSRLLTPQWQPGEVIAEKYEIPLPFDLPPGEYPLRLGYADLSGGRAELALSTGKTMVELATITVLPGPSTEGPWPRLDAPPSEAIERALANLDNQVALVEAQARAGWQVREASWQEPLVARAGRTVHLTLNWRALIPPRDSFTVFIHLIDGAGRSVAGHDYTPLGGSCPTYLWFPKWLPGQNFTDPYRLDLPADLPPGDYWLEVGMYGMTSLRRLPVVDLTGNLAGDRVILGPVRVE